MERFIAKRLYGSDGSAKGGSRPAIVIATIGIALGLAVMIVTMAVTRGFRNQIRDIVIGFTQHITVTNYQMNFGTNEQPITCDDTLFKDFDDIEYIEHAQRYIHKPSIIKTDSLFHGFVLKGIGDEYDRSFFEDKMIDGRIPMPGDSIDANWVMLSEDIAKKMMVKTGDKVDLYFMQNAIRARRATVVGIFRTNFSEYDQVFGITNIEMLQRLNGWKDNQATGLEIRLTNEKYLYQGYESVREIMDCSDKRNNEAYLIETMEELNAGLFAWLDVLNVNVVAILVLMLGISGFTMIAGLLIIIFERTATIGTLKALGADNSAIRKIFLYFATRIIGKGMIIGNAIGIAITLIQQHFHIIPLDPTSYYVDSVPMELGLGWLLTLNLIMFALSMLMLLAPSSIISRIYPSKTLRFE
ncbi:MAG: ABC transporter permease [Bacteroidaceae bacterium]|nr:ABC transporter permease [Bacteroidaceae bacterium]